MIPQTPSNFPLSSRTPLSEGAFMSTPHHDIWSSRTQNTPLPHASIWSTSVPNTPHDKSVAADGPTTPFSNMTPLVDNKTPLPDNSYDTPYNQYGETADSWSIGMEESKQNTTSLTPLVNGPSPSPGPSNFPQYTPSVPVSLKRLAHYVYLILLKATYVVNINLL